MKKLMVLVLGLVLALFASLPARAVEPMGAVILALIVIGPHVMEEQVRNGNLPGPPPECRKEKVKAVGGNYYFEVTAKDIPRNCV